MIAGAVGLAGTSSDSLVGVLFVTGVAEVSGVEAEEIGGGAAPATLPLDELSRVDGAVVIAGDGHGQALVAEHEAGIGSGSLLALHSAAIEGLATPVARVKCHLLDDFSRRQQASPFGLFFRPLLLGNAGDQLVLGHEARRPRVEQRGVEPLAADAAAGVGQAEQVACLLLNAVQLLRGAVLVDHVAALQFQQHLAPLHSSFLADVAHVVGNGRSRR